MYCSATGSSVCVITTQQSNPTQGCTASGRTRIAVFMYGNRSFTFILNFVLTRLKTMLKVISSTSQTYITCNKHIIYWMSTFLMKMKKLLPEIRLSSVRGLLLYTSYLEIAIRCFLIVTKNTPWTIQTKVSTMNWCNVLLKKRHRSSLQSLLLLPTWLQRVWLQSRVLLLTSTCSSICDFGVPRK